MGSDMDSEEYHGNLIWCESQRQATGSAWACFCHVTNENGVELFGVETRVGDVYRATVGHGRPGSELACEFARRWMHGLIDLERYERGTTYVLNPESASPFGNDAMTDDAILRALLDSFVRLYRWEESAGTFGSIDPVGVSLVLGKPLDVVSKILVDAKGSGLLEASPAAGYGETLIDGWARITIMGRERLRQLEVEVEELPVDATLVFTDIVRSTELAASLSPKELVAFNYEHQTLVTRLSAGEAGTIVDDTGDGFLLTFQDVDSAVRFALALHEEITKRSIGVRIGIHQGPITRAGGKVHGLAIIFAHRVMEASEGSGILLSEAARNLLSDPGKLVARGAFPLQGFKNLATLFEPSRD